MTPTKYRKNRHGVYYTTYESDAGAFTLCHDHNFHTANARLAHTQGSATFTDGHGNYAKAVGVRKPAAWCARHGFRS